MRFKTSLTLLLSASLLGQPVWGQATTASAPAGDSQAPALKTSRPDSTRPDYSKGAIWWPHFTSVYRTTYVAPVDMSNSNRLDRLLREGNIYLSLGDAIALALENNLDVAIARYGPLLVDTDILRSRAGAPIRGFQGGISTSSTASGAGGSATGGGSVPTIQSVIIGGPTLVPLDPMFTGSIGWGHFSTPLINTVNTGTNTQVLQAGTSAFTYSQAFLTGTSVSLTMNNRATNSNVVRNVFNPSLSSSASLTFVQNLTQGFGRSLNSRNILIARNNREVSDLAFKQQIISTVTQVENLYWDLVSFIEDVRVKQQALQTSQKLYSDNKRQVEIGTLAPIEIVRAEAEVASREQDLTISQTQVQQQEVIIKNALSKSGVATPAVADAHIIPTTRLDVPKVEAIEPIQDLIAMALQSRPELAQSRINMTNSDISLRATKNALLPTLSFQAILTNNALAGQVNESFAAFPGTSTQTPSSLFLGGFGTNLSQIFDRKFPDYSVQLNLSIPVRNRSAQADMAAAQLQHRQSELRVAQSENAVRVEVRNALIGLQQARARVDAAIKARILQEQTLDAEQKKYALGAETIYNVILAQRDLATAQSTEVAARNNYTKARVEIDRATGQTLGKQNVSLEEAYGGVVSKPPDPIPATPPRPNP